MKVLFINAPTPGYQLQPYPPLQLGYLASSLRETRRHEVEILDLGIEETLPEVELINLFSDFDIVGVYFVTMNWETGLNLCALAKSQGLITMTGGPHAGLNPEQVLACGVVDYVLIGESDYTIIEVIDALERGEPVSAIKGIAFNKNGRPIRTPVRSQKPLLDDLPLPARDLMPMSKYRLQTNDTSVLASRGCPYPCSFCAIRLMSDRSYRSRSPSLVMDEAEFVIKEYGFEKITFFDDIFTINRKYTLQLVDEMRARKIGFPWSCETRVDRVDRQLLRQMHAAGCYQIFYGVESGSQRILDSMSKGTTVTEIKEAIKLTKDSGINPVLSIMVGVPEDDETSIRETIAMVRELDAHQVWFQPFCPFPGTDIIHDIPDLLDDNWLTLYSSLDMRSPVLHTRYLTLAEVKGLYLEALMSVSERGWVKPQDVEPLLI